MSTGLRTLDLSSIHEREELRPAVGSPHQAGAWSPENFAREQIRGLVRQVFFSTGARPVRQVVFSATEPETDVRTICRRVGEALALETARSVAVVGKYPQILSDADTSLSEGAAYKNGGASRQTATRVRNNLWLVPGARRGDDGITTAGLHSHLCEVRREFEYSIVAGPAAGESNAATTMAQLADGIILVLSACRTRRATARKIKETLEGAQARILGTVLSDRVFPIPEGIYRLL